MDAIKTTKRMKSISEKAEEYAKTAYKDENLIEIASWDFEAGANYVLDKIEKCVNLSSSYRFKIDTIKQIIELLKK